MKRETAEIERRTKMKLLEKSRVSGDLIVLHKHTHKRTQADIILKASSSYSHVCTDLGVIGTAISVNGTEIIVARKNSRPKIIILKNKFYEEKREERQMNKF